MTNYHMTTVTTEKTIKVNYLARVEGEGAMYLKIQDGSVVDAKLNIFEPPRLFEGFLRGRKYTEAPDITARICGICPVAYQMSAVHAMENAFGVTISAPIRELRRLMYCGEWIESHALHIYMLHAPDFLGYESAIHMAKDYPESVEKGLKLKKIGNEIVQLLGGREIHPVNVRVGGFYKVPSRKELLNLEEKLEWTRDAALETAKWVSGFSFPAFSTQYEFVSLSHPREYPLNEGRLISNRGLGISVSEFEYHFEEHHVPHSNALHSVIKGKGGYFVGPMARYSLNYDKLSPLAKDIARESGLGSVCYNPFQSIIVRSIELLYACEEALRIIKGYEEPDKPAMDISPKAATGYGCTEAPRGILYHRYKISETGEILAAKIIPPTAQNQKTIEEDLLRFAAQYLDLPDDKLGRYCEQAIRNYDPCISCATHFLKLKVERA